MRVLRGLEALPDPERRRGRVATVGVFDGVHLGHFVVLRRVVERAAERGMEPAVVTFAGHPKELLVGRAPATVTSLEHRLLLFERIGLGAALVLEFTPALRELTSEQFVRRVLLDGMGMRELLLGWDSKFGRDRQGTVQSLQPLAQAQGFALEEIGPLMLQGHPVSSTAVREAVSLGEFGRAAAMLGRPVSLLGTVVHGDSRGRELGFPTANLDLHHELRPPDGVYAALALRRADSERRLLPAVVNIGTRPTFGQTAVVVEVHLLDFQGNLYGQDLEVFFLGRIRDERRFPGVEALVAQIQADVESARGHAAEAPRRWRIPGTYLPIEGPGPDALLAREVS
ncbi:MAG: riboflavin biosynthesis protein RibF [Planctomycetota bacterium]|nr:MAG: riboflavin biosynthesis protein RibF [Planctomycetota bacterium]